MFNSHNESRSAIAALRSTPVTIGFLNGGEPSVFTHSLNRRDFLTFTAGRKEGARHHRNAVHEHRAGAAGGIVTAALGSGQVDILTQHIKQQLAGLECELARAAVDS